MSGRKTRLWVSTSAAIASTPLLEVEMQGDLTINTGKTAERTPFKNGTVSAHGNAGWSASLTIGERIPMPAAQDILWDAHNDETPLYIAVKGPVGSVQYTGVVKVIISEDTAPTSGVRTFSVELSEDGQIVTGTAA